MIKVPQQQVPGVYHRRVGDIVVTAVTDGFLDGTLDVLRNIALEEARQILVESLRSARRTAVNAFLVYSAGRLALIGAAARYRHAPAFFGLRASRTPRLRQSAGPCRVGALPIVEDAVT
jgi:hypothetical protein